jgi:hypothetical protein
VNKLAARSWIKQPGGRGYAAGGAVRTISLAGAPSRPRESPKKSASLFERLTDAGEGQPGYLSSAIASNDHEIAG